MTKVILRDDKIDEESKRLSKNIGIPKESTRIVMTAYMEDKAKSRRPQKPDTPKGGISLREASRKYGIKHGTLSRWVRRGLVPVLLRARNWLYIDETVLAKLVEKYKQNPGRGKRTVTILH